MNSTFRLVRCLVAATAAWGLFAVTAAGAGASDDIERNPEIRFAKELQKMGYTPFAKEHLIRTRERTYLSEKVRRYAARYLGQICKMAGDDAAKGGDFAKKHDEYKEGILAYDDYLAKADPTRFDYHEASIDQAEMCCEMGRDAINSMKGTSNKDEEKQYKAEGRQWFDKGIKNLAVTSKFFKSLRDDMGKKIEGKMLTPDEKQEFFDMRKRAGEVLMAFGDALLASAELYKGGSEEETKVRNARLDLAIKTFEDVADYYSLFDVRYVAFRKLAMCWREKGDLDKAVAALKSALSLQPNPENIWIVRLARYELARTYNAFQKWDDAITAARGGLDEMERQLDADVAPDEHQDLVDIHYAVLLELYTSYVGRAVELVKKADEEAKKGNKVLDEAYRKEAKNLYSQALEGANEISLDASSKWARNAQALLKEWHDKSKTVFPPNGIPIRPGISTYMAEGRRLYNEAQYLEAIESFQNAIMAGKGKESQFGRTFLPEAWYLTGLCYYKLSTPAHTGGSYTYYYEAGECFSRAADYVKWPNAADAAFYCQQLFGAVFAHAKALWEAKLLNDEGLRFEGARYVRALERMGGFSGDQRAAEMMFQAAEMWRTLEQYEKASYLYSGVPQESKSYYQAKYLAGFCLYLEALKKYEAALRKEDGSLDKSKELPPEVKEKVNSLLLDAIALYDDYINWFDNNSERLGSKQRETVNRWIVETKVSYGKMLIHDVWVKVRDRKEGAERALRILQNIETQHLEGEGRKELSDRFLPEAFMIKIQAFRRLDRLDDAEKFVEQLVVAHPKHQLTARACGLLGYAYLQKRQELEEAKAPPETIRTVSEKAARWLKEALDRAPEKSLAIYNDLGAQLYLLGEYQRAMEIFVEGIKSFQLPKTGKLDSDQQFALIWLEDTYLKLESWAGVAVCARRLIDNDRDDPDKAGQKNIDYRSDLATALEKMGKCDEAVECWREVKVIAEGKFRPGTVLGFDVEEMKFTSVLHLAVCYVCAKQGERGFQVLGWYMNTTAAWLRDASWAKQAEDTVDKNFPGKWPEVGGYILMLVDGNVDLIREPGTRATIKGIIERHCKDKVLELAKKIEEDEKAQKLGTGK